MFAILNQENFLLYANKNYQNSACVDVEEFYEDVNRFKYLKKLFNKYFESGNLCDRLILNHIIVIFNVFGIEPATKMLQYKMDEKYWPLIRPVLLYLGYITQSEFTDIHMNEDMVVALRKI